jgi:hypothetical protein
MAKDGTAGAEWVEEVVTRPEKLRAKISASRSRSPRKRQKAADTDPNDGVKSDAYLTRQSKRRCTSQRASSTDGSGVMLKLQTEYIGTQFPDYEKAQMELEEDLELQRNDVDPTSIQHLPCWYPGWRRIQRLKTEWIKRGRPPEFGKSLNESNDRDYSNPMYILEAMGLDIVYDDGDTDERYLSFSPCRLER